MKEQIKNGKKKKKKTCRILKFSNKWTRIFTCFIFS